MSSFFWNFLARMCKELYATYFLSDYAAMVVGHTISNYLNHLDT
jgi:hypothetical protein